jgi:hypothetical protein
MKRIKILGLAVFAMFAITALGAVSAQAVGTNPVYFVCAKASPKGTGHHAVKGCGDAAKETGGSYNLVEGTGKKAGIKSKGGVAILHSVDPEAKADIPVECQKFKGSAETEAPNKVKNVKTTFSKCKALSAPCENVKKETIETKTLSGTLGWMSKEKGEVGTDLVSQAEPGGPLAEFKCEALGEIRTKGSVIGLNAGNVKVINKASTLNFVVGKFIGKVVWNEKGEEYEPIVNPPKFEGGPVDILKTEVKGAITGHPTEFYPPGGLPSGQEGVSEQKGEAVGIYEEGTI